MSPSARRLLFALGFTALACATATSTPEDGAAVEREDPLADPADQASDATDPAGSQGAKPGAVSPEPEPREPAPEPAPEPLDEAEIEEALAKALDEMKAIAPHARAREQTRRLPEDEELRAAWDEGRARAFRGRFEQVRRWLALAKFGVEEPTSGATGPLAAYDLALTVRDEEATLHVIVPARGPAAEGVGQHFAVRPDGERWVALADHLRAGEDYLPFKIDGGVSLNRQWGKREVIEDLVRIAAAYRERTGSLVGIGDISEATGGKIVGHWTHKKGVDADLYLLAPATGPHGPRVHYHYRKRGKSIWSDLPQGKGAREEADAETGDTEGAAKLRALAEIVLEFDDVAYFVHDDVRVLDEFDRQAGERRKGRRFLHGKNKAYWPRHEDHVHLRWQWGELSEDAPRP